MHEEQRPILDWINPPNGAEEKSLWACLHDADVASLSSDRLERSVRLEFSVPYLLKFHKLPADLHFVFTLSAVSSVRVARSFPWLGEFSIPNNATIAEQQALVADYQAKWCEESVSWTDFETLLSDHAAEISNAEYLLADGEGFALKLQLMLDDGTYFEAIMRSASVDVSRSDGEPLGLEELLQMGESYWDSFAAQSAQ